MALSREEEDDDSGASYVEQKPRSLSRDVAVDVLAAFGAGVSVAPFISLIDMAIIQNASGTKSLQASISDSVKEMVMHPLKFLQRRSFHLVTGVYVSTYIAANTTDTVCAHKDRDSKLPKFFATSATNIIIGIAKDKALTQMYGNKPAAKLPLSTYGLFATRDAITIAASFTMPAIVAQQLQDRGGYSNEAALNISQLTLPLAIQFFSTPLHLSGLDKYNNPQHSLSEHFGLVKREYLKSVFARMGRIFPAYGIGGVLNRKLRTGLNPDGPAQPASSYLPPRFPSVTGKI